jgi:hypothetical protein
VDAKVLEEVEKLTMSYKQLKRLTEAEKMWPVMKVESSRGQHEYDFVVKIGRLLAGADVENLAELRNTVAEVLQHTKRRGAQIITGERDGWGIATKLTQVGGSFLDEFAEEIAVAKKEAASERRKGKYKDGDLFFRPPERAGYGETRWPSGPAGQTAWGAAASGQASSAGGRAATAWGTGTATSAAGSQAPAGSSAPARPRLCFTCGEPGHMAKDCPKRFKEPQA